MTKEVILKKGDRVKVFKGKKFPIGLEGVVFWIAIQEQYGALRVGVVQDNGEKVFISNQNLEVIVEAPVNPFANKPIFRQNQQQQYAFGGAVDQDGGLLVFECGKCKLPIVKATSKKTGNKYWVNTFAKRNGTIFYIKGSPHTQEYCDKEIADIQEVNDWYAKKDQQAAESKRLEPMFAIIDALSTEEYAEWTEVRRNPDRGASYLNQVAPKYNLPLIELEVAK